MPFNFNPINGFLDTNIFPDTPGSDTAVRTQFMTPLNQIKEFLNTNKLDEWTNLLANNGYQKLNKGLILQWGEVIPTITSGVINQTINFPIAFPNKVYFIIPNINSVDGLNNLELLWKYNASAIPISTGQFRLYGRSLQEPYGSSAGINWFAIGN